MCPGTFVNDKYKTQVEGENGTSIENNINYIEQIIYLAKNFKDLYFIIRLKMDQNLNLLPKKLFEQIEKIENIEFNKVSSKVNTYQLLHISSFVIGRYTSLIEESLSDGINAVIYDERNFFSSMENYLFNKKILTAKNNEELCKYLKIYLDGKNLYNQDFEQEIKNFFSNTFINNNPRFKMQKILNELI